MSQRDIVHKLWNNCNVLRDDGISYGDYVQQLTHLMFLKMPDDNRAKASQKKKRAILEELVQWHFA